MRRQSLARAVSAALRARSSKATPPVPPEDGALTTAVRALGDALVVADAEGRVSLVNPRAAELVPELVPGAAMAAPVPLEVALAGEIEVADGERILAVTAAALEGSAGHVWTFRDVTHRARVEALKSDFVATASHELRSPLTSIKGFVELLEASRGLTERQQEWVGIVHVSTDRLVELVDDLLDVTRLEAGQVEIRRRATDVGGMVREAGQLLMPRLRAKEQGFAAEVPDGLPRALVDPGRLRQVLVNLLTNAHLYTDAGGRIGVVLAAEGQTLVVRVWDTGRGMTPEQTEQAFDRFYRGAESEGPQGTGLGLSIVRSIVELHRGTIDVRSEPGAGTTFEVRLPRALEREPGAGGSPARDVLPGRRVLVVDDEPAVTELIAGHLTALGVLPTTVHSGAEALEVLRRERFDAMTLDVLMPQMTGFEVLRALRADPELDGLPVVVVSVFSGREALSGEWTVPKPIVAGELADALGAAVVAARIRVLAVGGPDRRGALDAALDRLGIAHEWAVDADEVAAMCTARHYEVALVDAALEDPDAALAALDLRGRRIRRAVLLFSADGPAPPSSRPGAVPVAIADAGAAVLGLLAPDPADVTG